MKGRVRLDLITAVAMLLVLIVANSVVYAPKRRELDTITENLKQAEKELRYVAGHSKAVALVENYLPSYAQDAGDQRFLGGASAELDRLGLGLARVEPQGDKPYGDYVRRSYKLQLEGSYSGFSSFLEYLEELSDVVLIESFDYRSSAAGTGSRHRANLSVSVIGY